MTATLLCTKTMPLFRDSAGCQLAIGARDGGSLGATSDISLSAPSSLAEPWSRLRHKCMDFSSFEILAFLVLAKLYPFEGRRNMALTVWMLGTSKILITGLSIAFLPILRANRILYTAIGMVNIVIQGLLIIRFMILVILGAILRTRR